jgi:RecA-family ATPase
LPLSKSFFPLLQHAESIVAGGYEHACEIEELAFMAPTQRLGLIVTAQSKPRLVESGLRWQHEQHTHIKTGDCLLSDQNVKAQAGYRNPLPVIDPRDWQGKTVPERQWFVEGWIPDRIVTNLSGDGDSGKTLVVLQLIAASSLQTQWFGRDVSAGPCLYYGAEDEADELHRRLGSIVRSAGRDLSELDGIRLIPIAGSDAVLAEPDRNNGSVSATALFQKLESEVKALRPKLIVIDPSADVFGGDEINRSQVRKFVSMLRGLAIDYDCAVLLLSYPSLTGLNSGTGTSGSTAWNNSVRSWLYLQATSPETRVLKVVKANHG